MFDYITIAVLLFSCTFAIWRGFLKEIFSFSGWIFATTCSLLLLPFAMKMLEDKIANPFVLQMVALGGLFICFFLVFLLLNTIVLSFIKLDGISTYDRILGFVFGFCRGMFMLSLVYVVFSAVLPKDKLPEWYTEATAYKISKQGGEVLIKMGIGENLKQIKQ